MAETVEQNGPERSVPPAADAGHEPEARSQEIDREDVATTADGSGDAERTDADAASTDADGSGAEEAAPSVRTPEEWAELEQRLEEAQAERERMVALYQRLRADFDNYKRRKESEAAVLKETATADFIIELLPVVDNLERAADAAGDGEGPLAEGVRLVLRQLREVLEGAGVEVIPSVGHPFDPTVHEAVGQVPGGDGIESGTVVDELLKGYRMGERILRASMVRVAE
ncbi:MAG: nucleotide exchange factor GrpE [Firmicutes bacterium]|jgi:molecular chaperone GrpE|nr:nucleotide exchange factor GrpE [Bacillota bacterium]